MSAEYQETRLTEVDKLLKKIDMIYTAIKGKDENGNTNNNNNVS